MTSEPMTTALAPWGSRNDVRELKARLAQMAVMVPGGAKLDASAITALAQASIAHGLDPFNGEIWIIPGSGVMIGIKGLRKKAREQVQGNFWMEFREITSPEEKARLGIPANALAYESHLFDTENINTYTGAVEKLLKAGIPWEAVERMVGSRPYTVGIGYATPGEKSKMDLAQRAHKRAEADAIKRRFDVPFGLSVEPDGDAPAFEGEWVENIPASAASVERTSEEQAAQDAGIANLYGEPDAAAPAPAAPPRPQSRIWQRWYELASEANAIGLGAPNLDPAADDADVIAAGKRLAGRIAAFKEEQATEAPTAA